MRDLRGAGWIKLKGALFLLLGLAAGTLLFLEAGGTWKAAGFLVLCVWAFCRFYYFAFYVIEKYVDGQFRFSGLWNFTLYLLRDKRKL